MPTYELLQTLVTFLLEVQVVEDGLFTLGLREGCENDRHVELAPSLLLDPEGSLLETCIMYSYQHGALSKRRFEGQVEVEVEVAYFEWRACQRTRANGR